MEVVLLFPSLSNQAPRTGHYRVSAGHRSSRAVFDILVRISLSISLQTEGI